MFEEAELILRADCIGEHAMQKTAAVGTHALRSVDFLPEWCPSDFKLVNVDQPLS